MQFTTSQSNKIKSIIIKAVSVFLALLLWQVVAWYVNFDMLLASPVSVMKRLCSLISSEGFWSIVLFSFLRILIGFLMGFFFGIILAALSAAFKIVEILLWPYVITIKTVPVASFIILALIWLTKTRIASFVAFLMVFPIIYSNVLHGIKATDSQLKEMCKVYEVTPLRQIRYVYIPSVRSHLMSACTVSLGTAWKAGVAAEVIGVVNHSIGEQLYESKIYLMSSDLFAWTVVIIILSIVFEKVFLFFLRKGFELNERR